MFEIALEYGLTCLRNVIIMFLISSLVISVVVSLVVYVASA
jgi:hypothetical protein